MWAIFSKEFQTFFSSATAYVVMSLFLIINWLFLWMLDTDFNILQSGYADLQPFFFMSAYFLFFLIPAVTMQAFVSEKNYGTMEILKTKPITPLSLVMGKYFSIVILVILTILPTIMYAYTIYNLATPSSGIDFGALIGSYIGLFFLILCYSAISLFVATFTSNAIVVFLISVFILFFFYEGLYLIGSWSSIGDFDFLFQNISIKQHYSQLSKGLIDSRDIFYFISLTYAFLYGTKKRLDYA